MSSSSTVSGTDKELDKLDAERYDPAKFLQEWLCYKNYEVKIGKHSYKQITLDTLCFLWCIENPLVKSSKTREVTDTDIAIFLYVTQCEDANQKELQGLMMKAKLWFASSGIDQIEAENAVSRLVALAFQPLDMFPPNPEQQLVGEKEVRFDADWCSSMITIVHQACGLLPAEIMKMSVAACGWYYVQWSKQQGVKNIGRKSTAEVVFEMDKRCNTLIVERLIEKNIIKPEDKDYYLECMKSPSKRKKDFKVKDTQTP